MARCFAIVGMALASLACGCGDDDATMDAGFDGGTSDATVSLDGGGMDAPATPDSGPADGGFDASIDWPDTPDDYTVESVARVDSFTVPEPGTCCRDFGMISRDYVEDGTNEIDNALAELAGLTVGLGLDIEALLNQLIADDDLVLLLDHRELDGDTDPSFVLAMLYGTPDTMTGSGYLVRRVSFAGATGTPTSVFVPAEITSGAVTAGPGEVTLPIPLGALAVDYRFRNVIIEGTLDRSGPSYTAGTMAGYLLVDDYFEGLNLVAARDCACLGLTTPLYEKVGTTWTEHCVPATTAMTACAATPACVDLGSGTACEFSPILVPDLADLDVDSSVASFDALSFGLQFTASPATINGVEP